MIDRVEADHQWAIDSDPDLEARFVEAVDETINNTEQMVAIIGSRFRAVDWSQRSVNQVGGSGTLGRVWRQLKELELVVGIKRLRSEISDASSDEIIEMASSISMNRGMERTLTDVEDLIESVDSHTSRTISALRMRLAAIGVESDSSYTESSDDSSESGDGQNRYEVVGRYLDDVVLESQQDNRSVIEE